METYRYYPTGELAERINGLAQRVRYVRGGGGLVQSVDFPAGTPDVTVTHDLDGFVSQVVDGTGTTTWTRDLAGRATQLVQPNGTVSHAYDAAGARVTSTETGYGTTTWAYHPTNGRLLSVTDGDSQATTFGYDTAGRVDRVTYANGTYEERAFDALGRLSGLTLRASGGSALRTETMSRLADGRISSRTVDGQTVSYTYDEAGQLLTETRGGVATAYTYDGNFNRLTKSLGGSVVETYAYSDDDRLLSVTSSAGVRSFDYDNAGRTTAERWQGSVVKTYSWNADDRLTTATGAPGTRSYGYSFSGARASETGGQNRSWLRRGTGVTSPVLRDGVSRYSPGSSVRPLAGGDSAFQHGGWKSFEAQTGPTGAVTGTKEYDAFGAQLASTGAWQGALSHGGGFGYQSDDTGLQLLGHRYYDPSTGRFLTRDPIKDGPNWYAYCLNDPVNAADPTGLWFWVVVIAAIVIYDVIDTANDIREAPTNPETYAWVAVGAVDPTPGNLGKKAGRWLKGFIERHHSFPQAEAGKIIEVQPDKEGHPAFKEIVPMPFENHRGKGSIHSQGYNKMIADEIEKRGGYDGITDEGIDEIMDWLRGKGLR